MGKTKDVRAAVEAELGFDPRVDTTGISVINVGSNVNLTGTVPSYPQYLEAAAAARRVAGVSTVDNNLEVVLPENDYRDDVKLATAANNALAQDVTGPDSVEATVANGNVTLTGTVSYGTERGRRRGRCRTGRCPQRYRRQLRRRPCRRRLARPAGAGPLCAGP
jgi:osmotically-inducible protein OsmY